MKNNTNATVNATVNTTTMEEKNMMNITIEELVGMKRDELRKVAKEYSIKRYSKMTKDELLSVLSLYFKAPTSGYAINPLDDPEVQALDVSDEALLDAVVEPVVPVVEEKKEETIMVVKNDAYEKLMKVIAKEIIAQTLTTKNGKLVVRDYALFYKPTKVECADYMVMGKRLWGVVSSVIAKVYGEQNKTKENIDKTLEQMIAWGMITKVATERTYATLNPADMTQDEKDQLNNAWRNKQIKTEKTKDGKVKVTAINENGKTLLNQLYPSWTYSATAEQMNNTYKLSK